MNELQPLPIDEALPSLLEAVASGGAAILHAPPGAGKTTRVPPALAEHVRGRVVVLEPRRVAARAAARRIAEERGWSVGDEVGWWIRFERRFRPDTRIVLVTEGLLLRWLQRDPFLDGVDAVVFDEFHERALSADLALALVRRVRLEARPDLAVAVMSATLDPGPLAEFLDGAAVVSSPGRLHEVEIRLDERVDTRPLDARVASASRRALAEVDGDLLVFLPGRAEIDRCEASLGPLARELGADLLPLFGDLPIERQDAALKRSERRRIVLATNVAETSVTVEGVRAVVDSGLARQLRYDPATGLDRLDTIRVSRAAADQRAGRAGREGPGLCLRLWTAADDRALRPFEQPEVRRVDLAGAVLELAAWGERDPAAFEWFERPDRERLERAIEELRELGALDRNGLTPTGRELARLPLPPRLGRLVLEGRDRCVLEPAALAAAMLSERDPLKGTDRVAHARSRSDVVDRLAALDRGRHRRIFEAARQIRSRVEERTSAAAGGEQEGLLRAIAAAYLDRLCRRRPGSGDRALMVGGRGVRLGRESTVRDAELFVAVQLGGGRSGERSEDWVRVASAVERAWLPPELVEAARELVWDSARERVVGRVVERFGDLVLDQREVPIEDPDAASDLLVMSAIADPGRALPLDEPELARWLARIRFLSRIRPELGLPSGDEEHLVTLLPALCVGRRSFEELRGAAWIEAVLGGLTWEQRRALEAEAPDRLEVPSGSRLRLDYSDPVRPVLAVRIQELFGLADTPRIAAGRVRLLLHLLAPNGRPQQVTDDLASFWSGTYAQVRRELAGRYPKHAWPEDPTAAAPERRPRR